MQRYREWKIDQTRIITPGELTAVLADLSRRGKKSESSRLTKVIVRLAASCGLRASEISQLRLADVILETPWPHIAIRRDVAKCRQRRKVPLWWHKDVQHDLEEWSGELLASGKTETAPFVTRLYGPLEGKSLSRFAMRRRFRSGCACLGERRSSHITIHNGRHTFVSHALASGRSLAEVRDAAGHANVATTSSYVHIVPAPS